jgi:predicted nucleotidyltransferase
MRLSEQERAVIRRSVEESFGPNARVFLFGSRLDERRRGGDIDLYIETDRSFQESFDARTRLALLLEERLGEQKIDIVVRHAGLEGDPSPVYRVARETGVAL